jgi:5-methylthioadenosine/S-adenosylhomocysteine deaminase
MWQHRTMIDRYVADVVLPMDEPFSVHAPGFVDVGEGRVAACGPLAAAPPGGVREHRVGGLLMPGLVNTHAHSAMTVLRGAGEGLPLSRWLGEVIWPREGRLDEQDVRAGMVLGSAEMLLGGITTTHEMYFFPEAVAGGAAEAGIGAVVSAAIVDAPGWERFGSPEEQAAAAVELRDHWAGSGLVEIGFGPHSAYALPGEFLAEVGGLAVAEGMPVHIHVAESRTEGDPVTERTGLSVPAYLADLGLFRARTVAAHCVWLDAADITILAEHGVGVAHCPGSNGKLASGIAPVADLRRAGVPVGVATDGPASNDNLDLFEEAMLALLYARLRDLDAAVLGVEDALRMATVEAAAALGRDDLGALLPGRRADMIRVSLDHPAFEPVVEAADVVSHLVWAGSSRDVTDVWVGGERVVEAGRCRTVDLDAARTAVRAIARRIAG